MELPSSPLAQRSHVTVPSPRATKRQENQVQRIRSHLSRSRADASENEPVSKSSRRDFRSAILPHSTIDARVDALETQQREELARFMANCERNYQKLIAQKESKITELVVALRQRESEISKQGQQIEIYKTTISGVLQSIHTCPCCQSPGNELCPERADEADNEVQKQLQALRRQNERLQESLVQRQRQFQELQRSLETASGLESKLETERQTAILQQRIAKLEGSLLTVQQVNQGLKEELERAQQNLLHQEKRNTALTSAVQQLKQKLNELQTDFSQKLVTLTSSAVFVPLMERTTQSGAGDVQTVFQLQQQLGQRTLELLVQKREHSEQLNKQKNETLEDALGSLLKIGVSKQPAAQLLGALKAKQLAQDRETIDFIAENKQYKCDSMKQSEVPTACELERLFQVFQSQDVLRCCLTYHKTNFVKLDGIFEDAPLQRAVLDWSCQRSSTLLATARIWIVLGNQGPPKTCETRPPPMLFAAIFAQNQLGICNYVFKGLLWDHSARCQLQDAVGMQSDIKMQTPTFVNLQAQVPQSHIEYSLLSVGEEGSLANVVMYVNASLQVDFDDQFYLNLVDAPCDSMHNVTVYGEVHIQNVDDLKALNIRANNMRCQGQELYSDVKFYLGNQLIDGAGSYGDVQVTLEELHKPQTSLEQILKRKEASFLTVYVERYYEGEKYTVPMRVLSNLDPADAVQIHRLIEEPQHYVAMLTNRVGSLSGMMFSKGNNHNIHEFYSQQPIDAMVYYDLGESQPIVFRPNQPVEFCSPGQLYYPVEDKCVEINKCFGKRWFQYQGSCVEQCPEGYNKVGRVCEFPSVFDNCPECDAINVCLDK